MLAKSLGRLFEVGFNIGILANIEQNEYLHNYNNLYRRELEQLKLPEIAKRIVADHFLISTENIQIVEKWSQYFIQKGYLSGWNFFGEYINSTGWSDRQLKKLEIVYYQCSFAGDNSFGTGSADTKQELRKCLSQFGDLKNIDKYISLYTKKGEFLKADTLILIRCRKKYRILCVDLSVFSIRSAEDIEPLDNLEVLRRMLMKEISYLRSKSVFSKLRIDTGTTTDIGLEFSQDLQRYLTAFKRKDKETAKLIQAGSYAYSFYNFLLRTNILSQENDVVFNVVGYSDRALNSLSLRPENLDFLATCSHIYRNEDREQYLTNARTQVFKLIQRNAAKSFQNGKKFISELSTKPLSSRDEEITKITHTEKIENFVNSVSILPSKLATQLNLNSGLNLRDAHAKLVDKALVSDDSYLFLTGNPGIGKTTAIANFLRLHLDEGFLFVYISPRNQVNFDLLAKFQSSNTNKLCDDRLFFLNTNSIILKENNNQPTVQYHSNLHQDNFTAKTIRFINANQHQKAHIANKRLKRITADKFSDVGERTAGVLSSLSQGIHTLIDRQISNQIVATVSIQSLRITPHGRNTIEHLDRIFYSAYNDRDKRVIPQRMCKISQRIKHVFFMIDEITGDDSGANFLKGISSFFSRFELANYGFNPKIIVADASIVDPEVINQHLAEASPEADKIYFRLAKTTAVTLAVQHFQFNRLGARVINANSYPASSLSLTYKIFVECCQYNENNWKGNNNLVKTVQGNINQDINKFLSQADSGQVLVYIQDKRRLEELIKKLRQQHEQFVKNEDYLEIHANLSEAAKQQIQQYKNQVKVVFMTSSASRGLSFPKAKHILVEIPRFQIERNLMEIIQVIYRARGEFWVEPELTTKKTLDTEAKEIIVYLSDRAVYSPEDSENNLENNCQERKLLIQESTLNLLNILLVLKASIMTRISGAGRLGRKDYTIIPIGGKSVSAAGNTFSGQMTNLIRELKNEHRRKPDNVVLQHIYTSLQALLSKAEFVLRSASNSDDTKKISYLQLQEEFKQNFADLCSSLDRLLDLGKIEIGHLTGNLLVVPIADKILEETYAISLEEQIRKYATTELIKKMFAVSKSSEYPDNLRTAMRGSALELVKLLNGELERSQWFEIDSQNLDQYYALLLFTFISGETLKAYFASKPEEEESTEFRSLLSRYVHSLYPAYNTLPIGRSYEEFPFLIFRSYSLAQMRSKIFSDRYLLSSSELNVINLILAKN
ncbi:MAG: helicase-related protein [Oscillatoria sp. PMC 1051.18]|nr:helicase-related protein [Oscillatoria sp. PMC 1050.18]MEC5031706.1 helicase-related protein [Oscillatoria sp. PMC 1051.18]